MPPVKDCVRGRNELCKKCPTAKNRLGRPFLRIFKNMTRLSRCPRPWDWDAGTAPV
jgi:hypothetical protein